MAIIARDLDPSEVKEVFFYKWPMAAGAGSTALATGATIVAVGPVPFPCSLQSVRSFASGNSGAMQLTFAALRFAGGITSVVLGISNMVLNAYGTSGSLGYSGLAATGSTLLNLQTGDMLLFSTSGANTAASDLALNFVVKKLQDIVSHNGIST